MVSRVMKHHLITFVTVHHETIAKRLGEQFGKRGSDSDLIFYDGVEGDDVWITVAPKGYPDKLKSLLQAMAIGDIHVLLITPDDKFDALLGEMIVAMDCWPKTTPMFVIAGITKANEYAIEDVQKKLKQVIKTTGLNERMTDIIVMHDVEAGAKLLKQQIASIPVDETKERGGVRILVDASFPVKGVGTVILGIVKSGDFNAGDMLEMTVPSGQSKNLIAKSIQMQDIDQKSATAGDRVGIAVKGLKPEEIDRENVLVTKGSLKKMDNVKVKFKLSKFAKKTMDVAEKQMYHLAVEHQIFGGTPINMENSKKPGILEPGDEAIVEFKAEKSFSIGKDNNWAIVCLLEKFSNRLRIIGAGEILA